MAENTAYIDFKEKKRNARIRQERKMAALNTLAGGMAHNFNNLLMGIQANVSLMALEIHSAHPHYKRLKTIEKLVQSGSELNNQLLGYAREGINEFKPIDLGQLVEKAFESPAGNGKGIRVHRDIADNLHEILADRDQIEQALHNLCINATDAMPRGGDLFLKMENVTHKDMTGRPYEPKPGNYVLLSVKDTGIGMHKETMEWIFDPFYTTKDVGKGTGLGLSFVYGVIKAHNGYIDVYSEKTKGTSFKIYLPASENKPVKEEDVLNRVIKIKDTVPYEDDDYIIPDVCDQTLDKRGMCQNIDIP